MQSSAAEVQIVIISRLLRPNQGPLPIPGLGRSDTDIEKNITLFMKSPGVEPQPGKGWSATKGSANVYSVAFDFLDGGKPAQAIWSADLTTGAVKYVNQAAKAFSWTPKD